MSVRDDLIELKKLETEIKRKQSDLKQLRDLKKKCEKRIIDYCETNNQPGVRHGDMTVLVQERKKTKRQSNTQRLEKGAHVLQKYGIHNSKEAVKELFESLKEDAGTEQKLRII